MFAWINRPFVMHSSRLPWFCYCSRQVPAPVLFPGLSVQDHLLKFNELEPVTFKEKSKPPEVYHVINLLKSLVILTRVQKLLGEKARLLLSCR